MTISDLSSASLAANLAAFHAAQNRGKSERAPLADAQKTYGASAQINYADSARAADSAQMSCPITRAYSSVRADFATDQAALARLEAAKSSLEKMGQGLDALQRLFTQRTSSKGVSARNSIENSMDSAHNRLALADATAALARTVNGARFNGEFVLDTQQLPASEVNRLREMPALLAAGGSGQPALSLDSDQDRAASLRVLKDFSALIDQSISSISASGSTLAARLGEAQGRLESLSGVDMPKNGAQAMGLVDAVSGQASQAALAHEISAQSAGHLLA